VAQALINDLITLLLFFGIAGIVVPLLQRMKLPAASAYLLCGIVTGPWGISHWLASQSFAQKFVLSDAHTLHLLGELGIIALMFMIGLELSIDRLKELKRYIFGLGSLQIITTAFVIMVIAVAGGNATYPALMIGFAFAFSSTAIVMKTLEEKHLMNHMIGTLCFSVLLMQDLAVVPVVILATAFGDGQQQHLTQAIIHALVSILVIVPAMYVFGRKLLRPALNYVSIASNAEWLAAFMVFVVVLCATATYALGLSIALGAFLAGSVVAETEFRHEAEVMLAPVKGILLGIFFLFIGTQINVNELLRFPLLVLGSVLGLFAVKAGMLFLVSLAFKISVKKSLDLACYLSQAGEFALMVLGIVATTSLMPVHDVQFFLLVASVSMLCAPLMFKLSPWIWQKWGKNTQKTIKEESTLFEDNEVVVIAGFGRVGKLLGQSLEQQRMPYIAFDSDVPKVKSARKAGYNVIYGDAKKFNFWRKLHAGKISVAVIAIDDCDAVKHIIQSIRGEWPLLPIIVRAKDVSMIGMLYDYGATHVVTETLESSLSIARLLLLETGVDSESAEHSIAQLREKHVYVF